MREIILQLEDVGELHLCRVRADHRAARRLEQLGRDPYLLSGTEQRTRDDDIDTHLRGDGVAGSGASERKALARRGRPDHVAPSPESDAVNRVRKAEDKIKGGAQGNSRANDEPHHRRAGVAGSLLRRVIASRTSLAIAAASA